MSEKGRLGILVWSARKDQSSGGVKAHCGYEIEHGQDKRELSCD
jgi:hypothetical protein